VLELFGGHSQIKLILRLTAADLVEVSGQFFDMTLIDRAILSIVEIELFTRSAILIGRSMTPATTYLPVGVNGTDVHDSLAKLHFAANFG
jgi:hypothetical protein